MSPTIFRYQSYRFLFFSREEKRMHIHITSSEGEAKFWIEPAVELANNYGYSNHQINELKTFIEENKDEIERRWKEHFNC